MYVWFKFSCNFLFVIMVVDIILVIEFDKFGEYLVIGDWGGCVVLFDRMDGVEVSFCFYKFRMLDVVDLFFVMLVFLNLCLSSI